MDKKKLIYKTLNNFKVGVIATISPDNDPEAALIGFGQTEDLFLIFGTDTTTRKYRNLQTNSKIAFVVGDEEGITIQLEGEVQELEQSAETEDLKQMYWEKVPSAKQFDTATNRYFKISPTWIRYSDLSQYAEQIFELTF